MLAPDVSHVVILDVQTSITCLLLIYQAVFVSSVMPIKVN